MKAVFIHIGHIKTGTTALQSMFVQNREHFLEHGLLYPTTGIPVDLENEVEHFAHHLLCNDLSVGLGPFERECVVNRWQALRREIDDSPAERILVSSEMISYGSQELPWIARKALNGLEVHVVYCVRRQDTLIRSAYLQLIKDGMDDGEITFHDYVQKNSDAFIFSTHVDNWANAFGGANIHCFLYERQKDVRVAILNLIDPNLSVPKGDKLVDNPTLGPEYVPLLRSIHRLEISRVQKIELISELGGLSKVLRPKAQIAACSLPLEVYRHCYGEGNRVFARTWLPEADRAYFAYERDALTLGGHLRSRLARFIGSPGQMQPGLGSRVRPSYSTMLPCKRDKQETLFAYAKQVGEAYGCPGDIFDKDEVFRFFLEHPCFTTPQEAIEFYFKDGQNSAKLFYDLVTSHGVQPEKMHLLEISVGVGCVARHFQNVTPGMAVTSGQMNPEAAQFMRDSLKLAALELTFDPASLPEALSFDSVLALSFFTQLPRDYWERWLAGLFRSVRPGGVLIFTSHGKTSMPELSSPEVPPDGFWHQAGYAEECDGGHRGQTITLRAFVEQECQRVLGVLPLECREGFWFKHQDVYVLKRPELSPQCLPRG